MSRLNLVRSDVYLSNEQRIGIQTIAKREGVSAATIIRRVLDAYLGIAPTKIAPVAFKSKLPAQ
jgi:hypothetical protein